MVLSLIFSVIVLIIGILLLVVKRSSGKIVTAIGIGLIISFLFYFSFASTGIYGKAGPAGGYMLNALGIIFLIIVSIISIFYIKKSREGGASAK